MRIDWKKYLLTNADGSYDTLGNVTIVFLFVPFLGLVGSVLALLFGDVICQWVELILDLFN